MIVKQVSLDWQTSQMEVKSPSGREMSVSLNTPITVKMVDLRNEVIEVYMLARALDHYIMRGFIIEEIIIEEEDNASTDD